jgi:LPXTG-motif cell wall-anchored protein
MNRKFMASTMLGAAVVLGSAGPAAAAESQYPPVQPPAVEGEVVPTTPPAEQTENRPAPEVLGETVTDVATEATDTSTLPRTGAEWAATAAIGTGLLAGGAGLVLAARRRQEA